MQATKTAAHLLPEMTPTMNPVINPLMDALKLRQFTSQYKRHSIRRLIRPLNVDPKKDAIFSHRNKLRQSASDYFFDYCRQVIPRMEEKIELQLLEKFKDKLPSEAERKEVMTAYMQRKDNLAKMSEPRDLSAREPREESLTMPVDEIARVIMSAEGDGLSYHTFEDIGRYTIFPKQHWERMFPDQEFFGNYHADEFSYN